MLEGKVIEFPGRQWKRDEVACKLEQAKKALAEGSSEAEVSSQLGVPRTTLRYWLSRKAHLDGSENAAEFFESPDGVALLHRIVMAIPFTGMYSAQGIRGIGAALELAGLSRLVASSYGAQQQVATPIEEQWVAFGERHLGIPKEALARGPKRRISLVEDENFHSKPCLVGIEPVSDFIVLETYAEKRDAATWNVELKKALGGLNVEVVQSTSDEARGILAPVREELGAHHSPDLFPIQRDLARGIFPGLGREINKARTKPEAAAKVTALRKKIVGETNNSPNLQRYLAEAQQQEAATAQAVDQLEALRTQARESLAEISTVYHPYTLSNGQERTVESVGRELGGCMDRLRGIVVDLGLGEHALNSIDKARRLLPSLLATLTFVFTFILARVDELDLSGEVKRALRYPLIPAFYLHSAAAKAPCAAQRPAIDAVAMDLLTVWRSPDNPFSSLDSKTLGNIERVARECANILQRSSSCVEGRNGYLAFNHHLLHNIRPRKLRALTVVHNYYRYNGPTPAEQFFGVPHEELFTWLADHVDLPARPALKRPRPLAPSLFAAAA
jgi:hypothetical protein